MIDGRTLQSLPWCWTGGDDWLVVGWRLGAQVLLVCPVLLLGPVVSSTGLFVCIFCTVFSACLCLLFHRRYHLSLPCILHCIASQQRLRNVKLVLGQCGLLLPWVAAFEVQYLLCGLTGWWIHLVVLCAGDLLQSFHQLLARRRAGNGWMPQNLR